jgi:uncharacterized Rmd1/YagE family protein
VGDRIDVRGMEPRVNPSLPVMIDVAPAGRVVVLRAGAVVLFGVDPATEQRVLAELAPRISRPFANPEIERAVIRIGDGDRVDPDAIRIADRAPERLQLIAEALGKSVVLARYELEIAEAFHAIEPLALAMRAGPRRLPWRQRELVSRIGATILVEQQLVGRAEMLEKPDLIWDRPELDRFYARLEEEYELRERHRVLDTKLAAVARATQTMLDLSQTKRSINVEYYIVALIVLEIGLSLFELWRR